MTTSMATPVVAKRTHTPAFWRRMASRPTAVAAALLLSLLVLGALLAPVVLPDPNAFTARDRLQAPQGSHLFGTDNLGRDIFARTVYGARSSLLVGLVTGVVATTLGTLIGIMAVLFRAVDLLVMRIVDGMMSFPIIVLALSLVAILGRGIFTVVLSLVIVLFPSVTRVVRGTALVAASLPMIDAARAVGAGRGRILYRYVLPQCTTPILVQSAIVFTTAVLVESALSFIGAGLPSDVPSWGASLANARGYLGSAWWMWFFPGIALVVTVLASNILIDRARDILDPREASAA